MFLFAGGHDFDFLQFGALKTKERSHLNDLVFIYEILRVGAKFFYSRREFATGKAFGDVKTEFALAALRVVQAEFTYDHSLFAFGGGDPVDLFLKSRHVGCRKAANGLRFAVVKPECHE